MASINLLPEKEFEITTNNGDVIKGQFGTWALKRFCDVHKLSLREVGERFQNPSISDAVDYIVYAIERSARKAKLPVTITDFEVCDIIDQMGGMQSDDFSKLFNHSGDEQAADEEKKTEKLTEPVS